MFRVVLGFLSITDLLSVSQVSHLLQDEAWKEMMTRPIRLAHNTQNLHSFRRFLTNGDPSLRFLLRTLTFFYIPRPTGVFNRQRDGPLPLVKNIVQIVCDARDLHTLSIVYCDWILEDASFQPILRDTFSRLRNLRRLNIRTVDSDSPYENVEQLVLSLPRGILVALEIHMAGEPPDLATPREFPNILPEYQPRLKELSLLYPTFSKKHWKPFMHVRKAYITCKPEFQHLYLPHIAETFPNAKELRIGIRVLTLDPLHESAALQNQRDDARHFQASGGGWKSLDFLQGSGADLYALCVTCPVRRVTFKGYVATSNEQYRDVIAHARPRRVDLDLHWTEWQEPNQLPDPSIFLYDTGAVSHLVMMLSLQVFPRPQNITKGILVRSFSEKPTETPF